MSIEQQALILTKAKEIAGALNIKPNEAPMHKVDTFVKLLIELGVIDNFVALCENSLNNIELNYMTGFQKFLYLKKDYENRVVEKMIYKNLDELEKKAKDIAKKVKSVTNTFEEFEYKRASGLTNYKQLNFKNFGDYFSEQEIEILSKIGSLSRCISIQKSVSGRDLLEEKILNALSKTKMIEARGIFKIEKDAGKLLDKKITSLIGFCK